MAPRPAPAGALPGAEVVVGETARRSRTRRSAIARTSAICVTALSWTSTTRLAVGTIARSRQWIGKTPPGTSPSGWATNSVASGASAAAVVKIGPAKRLAQLHFPAQAHGETEQAHRRIRQTFRPATPKHPRRRTQSPVGHSHNRLQCGGNIARPQHLVKRALFHHKVFAQRRAAPHDDGLMSSGGAASCEQALVHSPQPVLRHAEMQHIAITDQHRAMDRCTVDEGAVAAVEIGQAQQTADVPFDAGMLARGLRRRRRRGRDGSRPTTNGKRSIGSNVLSPFTVKPSRHQPSIPSPRSRCKAARLPPITIVRTRQGRDVRQHHGRLKHLYLSIEILIK